MRVNTPITANEILLADDQVIVSKTDLQGNILFANPSFVQLSGFGAAELAGAPQNIVRHPDMPVEAFADLWRTVGEGLPWSGMLKNRCRNGDCYWSHATVTPVLEQGRTVGYLSVQTRPSREQVADAARLYAEFKLGNPRRLVLRRGRVEQGGIRGCIAALKAQLRSGMGALAAFGKAARLACRHAGG